MQDNQSNNVNDEKSVFSAFHELGRSQKIAVVSLAFFGVLVLGMWAADFRTALYEPFTYGKGEEETESLPLTGQDDLNIDTDKDGLTDAEEENIYLTSPYLEDTDSDGFTDGEEVRTGNNPLCAPGDDCVDDTGFDEEPLEALPTDEPSGDEVLPDLGLDPAGSDMASDPEKFEEVLSGQGTAEELRQMLLEAGMDEEMLEQISDEALLKSYEQLLQE